MGVVVDGQVRMFDLAGCGLKHIRLMISRITHVVLHYFLRFCDTMSCLS